MEVTGKASLAREGRLHCCDSNAQFDFGCLVKIFKERRFCDVILEVDNKEIAAHKVVLAVSSPYFYWKLGKEARHGHLNRVRISDNNYETLSAIVDYFYTSKVLITLENVECLLSAAFNLALTDLQVACRIFLQDVLDETNCFKVMNLARKYQCQDLLSFVVDYIGDHFGKVIKSGDFLDISHDQLTDLIAMDKATAAEEDILGCVLAWVKEDLPNRQQYVFSLLNNIRFPLMPLTSALTMLENEKWIKADGRYNLFLVDIVKCYGLKEHTIFPIEPRICNNCLVVVGRHSYNYLHMEIYDFQKKEWQSGLRIVEIKHFTSRSSSTISGSNVYLTDHQVLSKFDITNPLGTFTECGQLLSGSHCYNMVSDNKRIYVIVDDSIPIASFYDEVTGQWGKMPLMSTNRKWPGLSVLKGKLYSIGGENHNVYLSSVECYDPATNSWTNLPNMFHTRSLPGVAAFEDKLFVAGGFSSTDLKKCELFDLKDSSWTQLPDMKIARGSRPGVSFVNGFVYVVGGYNCDNHYLNSVEMYNLKVKVWSMLENPMSVGKYMVAVTLMNKADLKYISDDNNV